MLPLELIGAGAGPLCPPSDLFWEKIEIGKILGTPIKKRNISLKHLKLPKNHFKTNLSFVQLKYLKSIFKFGKNLKIWTPPPLNKKSKFWILDYLKKKFYPEDFWVVKTYYDICCWSPPFGLFPLFVTFFFRWLPLVTSSLLKLLIAAKNWNIWYKREQAKRTGPSSPQARIRHYFIFCRFGFSWMGFVELVG